MSEELEPADPIITDDRITLYFRGYCDEKNCAHTIDVLYTLDAELPEAEWEIVITSEGGEMSYGTALYSTLRSFSKRGGGKHHITTRVAGQATSAASLIFQAGDRRVGGKMDFLMIHEPMCSFEDAPVSSIRNQLRHADMWVDRMVSVHLERSSMSRPDFLARFEGKDWWIPMDEAVKLGLADSVA